MKAELREVTTDRWTKPIGLSRWYAYSVYLHHRHLITIELES